MTGMGKLRRDLRSVDAPNMQRMVAVTDRPPTRSKGMLRARLPLAVALLAATLVIPATAASAAGNSSSSDPTGVTNQVTGQSGSQDSTGSSSADQSATGSST